MKIWDEEEKRMSRIDDEEENADDGLEWYEMVPDYVPMDEEVISYKKIERRGRPKKQRDKVRGNSIRVRLTYHEQEKLELMEYMYNVNKSDIIRAGIHALSKDNFRCTEKSIKDLLEDIEEGE